LARGLPSPALATAIAGWMHFAVKVAHTPGGVLNDPMSSDILFQAKIGTQPLQIIDSLLSIQKIFGTDLAAHAGFKAELLAGFCQLAKNPDVITAQQISL
jgi:mannitol-1-phosphate/altronate dehydrogenase